MKAAIIRTMTTKAKKY